MLPASPVCSRTPSTGTFYALALLCLLAAPGAAQEAGTIQGRVLDQDGHPVGSAQVVVRRFGGGGDGRMLETTADGTYARSDVAAGLYTVTARKDELNSDLFRIRVRAGRTVEVNMELAAGRRDGAWIAELGDREAASRAFAAGLAANRAADYATAVAEFTRAVERRPDCAECSYNLAVAYAGLERFADAEAAFRQVLQIAPDYTAAHYGLSSIYTRQGRSADAAAARGEATRLALAQLAERRQRLQEELDRGIARLNAGEVTGARAAFESLLQQDSSFPATYYWLAVSLLRSNDPDRAATALRRYLRLDGSGEHAARAREELARLER